MAKKVVSVAVSGWKAKPTKRISKRRKLKSALKMIFNYMKSDSYLFAPLICPPVSSGEVSFKGMEKKLVEDEYLRCDAYMYAPLVMDPAYEESGRACDNEIETAGEDDVVEVQSERVKQILDHNCRSTEQKKPRKAHTHPT